MLLDSASSNPSLSARGTVPTSGPSVSQNLSASSSPSPVVQVKVEVYTKCTANYQITVAAAVGVVVSYFCLVDKK